jgi:hypothetical protein
MGQHLHLFLTKKEKFFYNRDRILDIMMDDDKCPQDISMMERPPYKVYIMNV